VLDFGGEGIGAKESNLKKYFSPFPRASPPSKNPETTCPAFSYRKKKVLLSKNVVFIE
jgi:hypothetical protein